MNNLFQHLLQLWRLLLSLLRRGRHEREMEEEMRFHLEMQIEQNLFRTCDSEVLKMVISQGIKLALIGMAIGLAGALGLTRFLSGLLYGVKPGDPLTLITVSALLIAVALFAGYIPARQAAKVDPLMALSHDQVHRLQTSVGEST